MDLEIPNIWVLYGLRENPFFQDELKASPQAAYPIGSLFVGREAELRLVMRQIGGAPSSRTIIEGIPGVGKTSFVNRVKGELARLGALTHDQPVRITSETGRVSFTADVLRTLLRIRIAKELESDAFWKRTAQILEGRDVIAGGVSLFNVGVNVERGRIPAEIPIDSLYEILGEALERLTGETEARVVIHVNNLENLGAEDAQQASVLMRDLRDYLLLPGAHWVFVGTTGIEQQVFRGFDQVSGIFPAAVSLGPLEPAEVADLVQRRYEHLRTGDRPLVPPVAPGDAARLYSRYQGDLRNFLRLLSDACNLSLGLGGIRPLSEEAILAGMGPHYFRALERRIGEQDLEYLEKIIGEDRTRMPEFRVSDAASLLDVTQAGASGIIARLVERGAIVQSRTVGRSTYYRLTGDTCIALGISSSPSREE